MALDPALTLAELLEPVDENDVLEFLLTELGVEGFDLTDENDASAYLAMLRHEAAWQAKQSTAIQTLAKGGLMELAEGAWLDLFMQSRYGIARTLASFAVVRVRLTNPTGAPHSITPGALRLTRNPATTLQWISANSTTVVLPASSTLDLDFRAESPGPDYNLALASPVQLATPLPGVTVALVDVGGGTPMVTAGAPIESDPAFRARGRARWGDLSWAGPALSYLSWARAAAPVVTKVFVDDTNPSGPGTVTVYLATATGAPGGGDVAAVNALVQLRKPPTAQVTVVAATVDSVTFGATAVCATAMQPAAREFLYARLSALRDAAAIGDGAFVKPKGRLLRSDVADALLDAPGVTEVDLGSIVLNGLGSDYTPAKGHMAIFAAAQLIPSLPTITFVAP